MKKKSLVNKTELPLFEQVQSAKASSSSASKKIATPYQTVKVTNAVPLNSSPYGLCRCGELIAIPGLDGYLFSQCGWVAKILGGRK